MSTFPQKGTVMSAWPRQDFRSMCAYYGAPGTNQVRLALPAPLRLAWNKTATVNSIMCHRLVAPSLGKILGDIREMYSSKKAFQESGMDLFGGCLNVRKKRGGDTWSIHSWGCAIDLDPERNTMGMHRAQASMPESVIQVFVDAGWVSLGHSRDMDFMHFQAARL